MYVGSSPRTQKHKQEESFVISQHISSKINPRHVPTFLKVLGFYLNPSHKKTQAIMWPLRAPFYLDFICTESDGCIVSNGPSLGRFGVTIIEILHLEGR